MESREINLAGRDKKVPVNQIHDAISEVRREVRPVISATVFAQPPRDIHAGKPLAQSQLHIGISLVIPQENVETRLALLDKVILKRQRFFIIGNDNVVDVN